MKVILMISGCSSISISSIRLIWRENTLEVWDFLFFTFTTCLEKYICLPLPAVFGKCIIFRTGLVPLFPAYPFLELYFASYYI
jgi:hypothetical protein